MFVVTGTRICNWIGTGQSYISCLISSDYFLSMGIVVVEKTWRPPCRFQFGTLRKSINTMNSDLFVTHDQSTEMEGDLRLSR